MKLKETILVVDDEEDVLNLVRYSLQKAGYDVLTTGDGLSALSMISSLRPDAVVLDLMLPKMDGLTVCRETRANPEIASTPILMLTAKSQSADKIKGLQVGADDYLTKPFSTKELVLRIAAILRRSSIMDASNIIEFENFRLDKQAFALELDGQRLDLTVTEFKLLAMLLNRRGKILSRDLLLNEIWGYRNPIDTRTVDTHMRRLRSKLGKEASHIETVRGEGYRFRVDA